ncbi:MAG: hypothetical protein GWO87_01160 [Xanthomonadaceae bacterium]|nr:hypothetical protein [Rhodospirillaceae bacterium]NIA17784.1 hypothetical protein [Xanthomonadaceae bacterium]
MINYFNQTVLNRKRSVSIILTLFSNFLELRNCEEERRSNPENISPIIGIASSVASLLSRKDSKIYVFRNSR